MLNTEPAFDSEIKEDVLYSLIMAQTYVFHFTAVLLQREVRTILDICYCNVYVLEHVKANSQFLKLT